MSETQPVALRFLSQEDAIEAGVADMAECVDTIEYVFELYNQNRVIMGDEGHSIHGHVTTFPGDLRESEGIETGGPDRRFSAMPAYVGGDIHEMGIKWYGSNARNPSERGIPRSLHTITLNDPDSGQPVCIMDGQVASGMRTGAVAGVGAAHIQGDRADVATIFGPGVVGQTSALALDEALDLETIRIYHPELWKAEAFEDKMRADVGTPIEPVADAETAVRGSDVTVVATTASPPPAIDGEWLDDDTLVIPLGDLRVPLEAFDPDRVFCDIPQNTLEFAENLDWAVTNAIGAAVDYNVGLELDRSDLRAIHEVIAGEDTDPTDGTSIFYSPGLPMEDVAWTSRVFETAKQEDIGQTLTLFSESYFDKPY